MAVREYEEDAVPIALSQNSNCIRQGKRSKVSLEDMKKLELAILKEVNSTRRCALIFMFANQGVSGA